MAFNYESSGGEMMNSSASCGGGGGCAARDGIEMVPLKKRDGSGGASQSGAPLTPRTPRRILSQGGGQTSSATQTPKKLQFTTPEVHTVPPSPISMCGSPKIILTNRKREEAIVMANLRKKVPAWELTPRKTLVCNGSGGGSSSDNIRTGDNGSLDNRPSIIPKIALKASPTVMDSNNNCNSYDDLSSVKASTATTSIQDKDFILELLCWHNEYRARHAVTALSISTELCEYAQIWANHLAAINEFYYRSDKTIGQNLFCCPVSALVTDLTGQEVASFWYSTVRRYNYYKESHLLHTNVNAGHFAQMIWASSRYLGVGKASSKTGKIFVVAFYFPPGNLVDAYHTNVPPPIVEQQEVSGSSSKLLLEGDNNPIASILKQ